MALNTSQYLTPLPALESELRPTDCVRARAAGGTRIQRRHDKGLCLQLATPLHPMRELQDALPVADVYPPVELEVHSSVAGARAHSSILYISRFP